MQNDYRIAAGGSEQICLSQRPS